MGSSPRPRMDASMRTVASQSPTYDGRVSIDDIRTDHMYLSGFVTVNQ